jgi:putative NIF3 family GTP cyclohydrolase 1 type 2
MVVGPGARAAPNFRQGCRPPIAAVITYGPMARRTADIALNRVSRRAFVRLGTAGAVAAPWLFDPAATDAATVTAQEVVDRIRKAVGVEWEAATADGFKAGDASAAVTGIVTTSLATIDVLRRAVKAGANMIVSAGPTFYSRGDSATPPAGRGRGAASGPAPDPVFTGKNDFIRAHNLIVWRFSDHWRLRRPDPFAQGLAEALGWARYRTNDDPARLTVPAVTLEALAARAKSRLDARGGIRVVGASQTRVRTIGVLPGTRSIRDVVALLPQVDAIVAGEIREWESSEYLRDVVNAGLSKGLILLGRSLSEDPAMKVCADWLRPIVPDVQVRWLPAGDPFWRPTT